MLFASLVLSESVNLREISNDDREKHRHKAKSGRLVTH